MAEKGYLYKVGNTLTLAAGQEAPMQIRIGAGTAFRWKYTTVEAVACQEPENTPLVGNTNIARGVLVKSVRLERGGTARASDLLNGEVLLSAWGGYEGGQAIEAEFERLLSDAKITITLVNQHTVPVMVSICLWGVIEPYEAKEVK